MAIRLYKNLINSRKIQTKLRVSKPSDACEEEADLVASQIMGASNLPEESYLIKRSSVDKKVHRKCKGCEDDEKSKTRFIRRKRKSSSFEISDIAVKDISQTFSHEGPPLETTIREFMESKFAYDFSGVRIHADEEAGRSAELANALAYTVGNDIVFGKGQYQPSTFEGKRLLAHELAHVIQQETTFVQNNPPLVVPFDVYEHDSVSNFTEHYLGDYTRRTRIGRIMSFVNTSEELANGYDANFDDGFLYQANGTTTCTFPAGTATSTVTNPDPCTADCTSRHEGVHAADIGPCCAEAGKAYRADSGSRRPNQLLEPGFSHGWEAIGPILNAEVMPKVYVVPTQKRLVKDVLLIWGLQLYVAHHLRHTEPAWKVLGQVIVQPVHL